MSWFRLDQDAPPSRSRRKKVLHVGEIGPKTQTQTDTITEIQPNTIL